MLIMPTIEQSIELVKSKILWFRKGTENSPNPIPSYEHSIRVYEMLKKNGYPEHIQVAWLLHDIIEDWWMTLEELKSLGYSDEILHLVEYATYDEDIVGSYDRRETMLQKIIQENDRSAFIIKFVDYLDNLSECYLMSNKDKLGKFIDIKWPFFCYYWYRFLNGSSLYIDFLNLYWKQHTDFHWYFKVSKGIKENISLEPILKHFLDGHTSQERPIFRIITWDIASGKSRLIKNHYINSCLWIDPGQIEWEITEHDGYTVPWLEEYKNTIGKYIVKEAVEKKYNIVIETNLSTMVQVMTLAKVMWKLWYKVEVEAIMQEDVKVTMKNNESRSRFNMSSYYTQEETINRFFEVFSDTTEETLRQ